MTSCESTNLNDDDEMMLIRNPNPQPRIKLPKQRSHSTGAGIFLNSLNMELSIYSNSINIRSAFASIFPHEFTIRNCDNSIIELVGDFFPAFIFAQLMIY